jgi:DNA-binding transcriptional regulator YiaG
MGRSSGGSVPNLGSVLKDEITRLARRALRGEIDAVKKASSQHRKQIAALKRQVQQLERQNTALVRRAASARPAQATTPAQRPPRFVAKGLRSHRSRLGLSAEAFAKLAGVTAQTIYNWERGEAHPRAEQLARLVALRGIGKREAGKRLEAMGANGQKRRRARAAQ